MIWQEPHRGSTPDPAIWMRPGLEQVQIMIAGGATPPPLHYLTGMRPTAAAPGTAEFEMPATPWLASPSGFILGGALAILADGPLGCAIQTTLPPGTPYTTSDLSMSYLRPAVADGRTLTARGRLVHAGRSLALSEVTVSDADGRDLAHCTSRCFLFPSMDVPADPPPVPAWEEPPATAPPPFARPHEGGATPADAWRSMSGLDLMRGWIEGSLPAPPVYHLTGERPVEAEEGSCTFAMPATPWLASPTGLVEGGVLVMLADAAIVGAAHTTVPAGTAIAPADTTVKFIRPAPTDGRDLTATARVLHRGRTIAVCEAQIHNADGKLLCVAVGSTMILPGRDMTAPIAPQEELRG